MTAFMRLPVVYDLAPEYIIPAKRGIDVVGDVVAGLWYFFMPLAELCGRPTFFARDWPATIKVNAGFQRELQGSGQFPPLGWRIEDPSKAPPWLVFKAAASDKPYNVILHGTPTEVHDYEFQVRVTNSYDPNNSTVQTLKLSVVE